MLRLLGTVFAALLGLAFGSFLNVCLSRWPQGESVVKPRSHCRTCNRTLTWWENIPVLSWLSLRGRCRTCQAPIHWRYPLVEAVVAVLWAICAWRFFPVVPDTDIAVVSFSPAALLDHLVLFPLCWLLVALAALDAEHLWLPDFLTLPGILAGLVFTTFFEHLSYYSYRFEAPHRSLHAFVNCLIGILAAAALILLIR